jgi:hypothetical protein
MCSSGVLTASRAAAGAPLRSTATCPEELLEHGISAGCGWQSGTRPKETITAGAAVVCCLHLSICSVLGPACVWPSKAHVLAWLLGRHKVLSQQAGQQM